MKLLIFLIIVQVLFASQTEILRLRNQLRDFKVSKNHHHRIRKMKKQPNLKDEAAKKKSPDAEFDAFSPYKNRDKSDAQDAHLIKYLNVLGQKSNADRIKWTEENFNTRWKDEPEKNEKIKTFSACTCGYVKLYTDNRQLPFIYANAWLRNPTSIGQIAQRASSADIAKVNSGIAVLNDFIKNLNDELNGVKKCDGVVEQQATTKLLYRGIGNFYLDDLSFISVDKIWQNSAFTSTTDNVKIAYQYSNCVSGGYIIQLNVENLVAARSKLGKWIDKCSAYPEEKEFLLNYGQCWKVTKVTPNSSDNGPTGTTAKGCTGAAFTFTRVELSNVACPESPLAPNYTGL